MLIRTQNILFLLTVLELKDRNQLAKYLLKKKIYTTLRYHPLHLNKIYNQKKKFLKNTQILNKEAISIPLHPRLTMDQCRLITKYINEFYK
jgi:dTDP-4-amino-4,6-dideoxygalactose transaminase